MSRFTKDDLEKITADQIEELLAFKTKEPNTMTPSEYLELQYRLSSLVLDYREMFLLESD